MDPHGRVLAREPIRFHGPNGVTEGEVLLGESALRVVARTRGATESAVLELALGDVEAVERATLSARLLVRAGGTEHVFSGDGCTRAYAWLRAIIGDAPEPGVEVARLLAGGAATLARGALSPAGHWALSTRRVVFAAQGGLRAMLGSRELVVDLDAIDAIELRRRPRSGVTVQHGDSEDTLGLESLDEGFASIVRAVAEHTTLAAGDDVHAQAAATLGPRGFGPSPVEQTIVFRPVLWWTSRQRVERAWLSVSNERVRIVPHAARTSALEAPVDGLTRDASPNADAHETSDLRFFVAGDPIRLTPIGGPGTVELFWSTWRPTSVRPASVRPTAPPPSGPAASVDRVLGDARFVGLFEADTAVARVVQGAAITLLPDGSGLWLRGIASDVLEPGTAVLVDVERANGFYRFDTVVVGAPASANGEAGAPSLLVAVPTAVRSFNRRDSYRQSFDLEIGVRAATNDPAGARPARASGAEVAARLTSLSVGGCAFECRRRFEIGARIAFALADARGALSLVGDCVWSENVRPESKHPTWRHGVRFVGISERDHDRLHKLVLDRERELTH